jgi:hypothetical protein
MNPTEIRFNELLDHVAEKLNLNPQPPNDSEIVLVHEDRDTGAVAIGVASETDALEWVAKVDPSGKAPGQILGLISSRTPAQRVVVAVLRTGGICADYLDVEAPAPETA